MNPTNSELADKLEQLLKWNRWDDARLGHWLRGAGDRVLTALRTRKSEALADDAVEHIVNDAIVAKLIESCPNSKAIADWGDNRGFKCVEIPVGVGFMTIHTRPLTLAALSALSALTPSPAVDLLREAREACFRDALAEEKQPDRENKFGLVARIDAELKKAK